MSVAIPTSITDLVHDGVLLLLGIDLKQIATTLLALSSRVVPGGVPLLEEVAAGGEGGPRRTAACHSSCCCASYFWKREASSSASLLTRSGACRRLGPSTARGFHPALASLVSWVVRPVGAGGLSEAEGSTRLLVDPPLAAQVVSGVLHVLLDDTT